MFIILGSPSFIPGLILPGKKLRLSIHGNSKTGHYQLTAVFVDRELDATIIACIMLCLAYTGLPLSL